MSVDLYIDKTLRRALDRGPVDGRHGCWRFSSTAWSLGAAAAQAVAMPGDISWDPALAGGDRRGGGRDTSGIFVEGGDWASTALSLMGN
jgi:hypothetical protein